MTDTPKRRGRPSTGTALTPAQRMARARQKGRDAIVTAAADLTTLSDTALLEAFQTAYRHRDIEPATAAAHELLRRLNTATVSIIVADTILTETVQLDSVTVADTQTPDTFTLAPTEPTADTHINVLERIKAMRQSGLSADKVADKLNAEGVLTSRGGRWHGGTIRNLNRNRTGRQKLQPKLPVAG